MCRVVSSKVEVDEEMFNQANLLESKCDYCPWVGKPCKMTYHLENCDNYDGFQKEKLNAIIYEMIGCLEIEIAPHIEKDHNNIFKNQVNNW